MTTVTTIAGQQGVSAFKPGTLTTATFGSPRSICIDSEGNILGCDWIGSGFTFLINEEQDIVMSLPLTGKRVGMPAIDATGQLVIFPDDGADTYYTMNSTLQWALKSQTILHPTTEDIANGWKEFNISWKNSLATCLVDGMVYTYDWQLGNLVKFDPKSRKGSLVATLEPATHGSCAFDRKNPNILYIGLVHKRSIYSYNIETNEYKNVAGTLGLSGYRDGDAQDALFGDIGQLIVDETNALIIADDGNHCIRKWDPETNKVTTLIGRGGVAGYQDGNAEDALFRNCSGLAIDNEYNIYIGDRGNCCIRKLAVQ
jgi:hypothetical protein